MGSMKTGAGDDPFADDDSTESEKSNETTESQRKQQTDGETDDTGMSKQDFPYVMRRERVKDDRPNEHVAFLRDEYSTLESDVLEAVAAEMDIDQSKLSVIDLREAFVELGDRHPEELADILDGWGYEYR